MSVCGKLWPQAQAGLPFRSVQFSRSVVSNSLQPHESQHTRPHTSHTLSAGIYSGLCFTDTNTRHLVWGLEIAHALFRTYTWLPRNSPRIKTLSPIWKTFPCQILNLLIQTSCSSSRFSAFTPQDLDNTANLAFEVKLSSLHHPTRS